MRRNRAYEISILALFIAIVVVQNVVPILGYIPIGPLTLVTIHITVSIAAITLGTRDGAIVGGVWGLITWVRAFTWPTSPMAVYVMVNPVISVLPRILVGVIAGLLFQALYKRIHTTVALSLAGIAGALINTIFVLGFIYIFYQFGGIPLNKLHIDALMPYLIGVVGTNGIPEAILAGILVPLIATPLLRFRKTVKK
ncbi:putative membrane protein [Secundilactobacillus oryzae JCM 18671]|uniref:Putative membrane protein n=1 Tax=Secundilactobacillus oryzae JCM 18671 TaxID=1291743 RepID=A0A081BK56_9LACO|nr:ECF transporter S component [Secundilactobacillus oryzae]GAK48424.1 putative membrane protein [Secundilactobacillus oryzae JCM 18671]